MQGLKGECEVRVDASAACPISKVQEYVRYQARHHPSEVIPGWPVKRQDEQDRPDPRIGPAQFVVPGRHRLTGHRTRHRYHRHQPSIG